MGAPLVVRFPIPLLLLVASACQRPTKANQARSRDEGSRAAATLTFEVPGLFEACQKPPRPIEVSMDAQSLDTNRLLLLLWASGTAYRPGDQISTVVQQAGFDAVRFVDMSTSPSQGRSGLQAFVAARDGMRIVAFRGTQEANDWMTNLLDTTTPGAPHGLPGWVHAGYAGALSGAWAALSKALADVGRPEAPLLVTGHSLGGALATLFVTRLAREGKPATLAVTFAAPRVGDENFAKEARILLDGKLQRVVNEDDVVPRIPAAASAAEESARLSHPNSPWASARAWHLKTTKYAHVGQRVVVATARGATAQADWTDEADKAWYGAILTSVTEKDGRIHKPRLDELMKKREESHRLEAHGCPLMK